MASDDSDTRRKIAVSERDAGVGGHGISRGYPWDHFEGDARGGQHLRLFAAPAEDEGVAAFEAHHALAFARLGQQQRIQLRLRDAAGTVVFAAVDDLSSGRRVAEQFAVDQAVIDHHFGAAQEFRTMQGEQPSVTGTGAHQIDDAAATH